MEKQTKATGRANGAILKGILWLTAMIAVFGLFVIAGAVSAGAEDVTIGAGNEVAAEGMASKGSTTSTGNYNTGITEDTVWGATAPDGSVVSDYTWEMHMEARKERSKNGIRVRINGIDVEFPDQMPVVDQGRVLVPMRQVFEHVCVQCRVSWDSVENQATVLDQRGRRTVFQPGAMSYTVYYGDGRERKYVLDVPATVIDGRVLLPLRALMETFAFKVEWSDIDQRVDIQDSFPGWRKLMRPDEWKKSLEEECVPCAALAAAKGAA